MKLHSYALVHLHQSTCVGLGTAYSDRITFVFLIEYSSIKCLALGRSLSISIEKITTGKFRNINLIVHHKSLTLIAKAPTNPGANIVAQETLNFRRSSI